MASYRPPFPPPSATSYPPPPPAQPQQPPPPPQQQHQQRPNQFPPSYPYPPQQLQPPQQSFPQHYAPPPPPPSHQQYPFQPPPPPPPPESSYPPPPPPPVPAQQQQQQQPGMYYPASGYSQFGHQSMQPPPPPLPPSSPSSAAPPPPPPGSPPPAPPKESGGEIEKGRREHGHSSHGNVGRQHQQQRPPVHSGGKKPNVPSGRVETEEERRLRKKREYEKQRQEEKHRQHMKESQSSILQKSQMLSSQQKGHGSIVGSRMADRRATPLLSAERVENRLKKPTTFLCKMKFRNELPDPSAQLKWMPLKRDPDRYTRYTITSLEKMHKPQLYVEPDLGIPLDLLDLSVYNRPAVRPPLDPEDEELLRDDDEVATPVKKDGIKRKERPTDKGVSWLVKTQYISSLSTDSTKQSLTEKQAKELREMKEGRNILENLNDRERQIKAINASFEACKLPPVHSTNKNLHAVETFPFLPHFARYDDKFVLATFDNAPTADSEIYSKLDPSIRYACESQAIMKAFVASTSDPSNPEKIMSYVAPNPDELSKDMFDEDEDRDYKWLREYNWEVRGEDANDPTNYLVSFDENEARYLPLATKLTLRKRRAREGRSGEEAEQHPVPSKVTVRRRATAATKELRDSGGNTNSRVNTLSSRMGSLDVDDDGLGRQQDAEHSAGSEDDVSE